MGCAGTARLRHVLRLFEGRNIVCTPMYRLQTHAFIMSGTIPAHVCFLGVLLQSFNFILAQTEVPRNTHVAKKNALLQVNSPRIAQVTVWRACGGILSWEAAQVATAQSPGSWALGSRRFLRHRRLGQNCCSESAELR